MKYTFFWGGIYSNWYKADMLLDNIIFTSNEQYMMWIKATVFGDHATAGKILATNDSKKQKELGRQVVGYNDGIWIAMREHVVYNGLKQKFLQNPDLLEQLKEDKDTIFVEASPEDRVWGIGYDKENALANIDNWGQNLLGKLLNKLADELCK